MGTRTLPPGPKGHFLRGHLPELGRDPLGFLVSVQPPCATGRRDGREIPRNSASPAATRKFSSRRPCCHGRRRSVEVARSFSHELGRALLAEGAEPLLTIPRSAEHGSQGRLQLQARGQVEGPAFQHCPPCVAQRHRGVAR